MITSDYCILTLAHMLNICFNCFCEFKVNRLLALELILQRAIEIPPGLVYWPNRSHGHHTSSLVLPTGICDVISQSRCITPIARSIPAFISIIPHCISQCRSIPVASSSASFMETKLARSFTTKSFRKKETTSNKNNVLLVNEQVLGQQIHRIVIESLKLRTLFWLFFVLSAS